MSDWLQNVDTFVFYFINDTIKNPVFDWLMPFITNQKNWYPLFALVLIWLLWKGGKKGRIAALLLVFVITLSDQVSAGLLKPLIGRPRPCIALDHIHALIGLKTSFSFPSSHAANSCAAATLFSFYYRKGAWIYISLALMVCISRVYVGVHYPVDVLAGGLLGACCAFLIIALWNLVVKLYNLVKRSSPMKNNTVV